MATKTLTQKLHSLTLDSDLKILNEFFSEPCSNLNFTYIAKFEYNANGRTELITIFNNSNELVCEISKKEIENIHTKFLAKQNIKILKERIESGDIESIKILFLRNCIFN